MCKEYLGGADLDPEYENTAKLPIFFSHTPNGASIRQFQHFDQKFYEPKNDTQFRMFNFGYYRNKRVYGQNKALAYGFHNIKIPMALLMGMQDILCDPGVNVILTNKLKNADVNVSQHIYHQWAHIPFIWIEYLQTYFEVLLGYIRQVSA